MNLILNNHNYVILQINIRYFQKCLIQICRCDFNVSSSGDRDLNAKSEEFIKSHFMAKDRVQSWNFQKPGPVMLSQK